MPQEMSYLEVKPDNIAKRAQLLLCVVASLLLMHFLSVIIGEDRSWQLNRLFNLDLEGNIPNWFSGILLAICSLEAYECSRWSPINNHVLTWRAASIAFMLFSCDEISQIHEYLAVILQREVFRWDFLLNSNVTLWQITVGPFVLPLVIWLTVSVAQSVRGSNLAARFLGCGVLLYVVGIFLLELTIVPLYNNPSLAFLKEMEIFLEEGFEMCGVVMILAGLAHHKMYLSNQMGMSQGESTSAYLKEDY